MTSVIAELFWNLHTFQPLLTAAEFGEAIAPLESVEFSAPTVNADFDETGLLLKELIEETFTDGVDKFEGVTITGRGITGAFYSDNVKYNFKVTRNAVQYKQAATADMRERSRLAVTFSDMIEFAKAKKPVAVGKKSGVDKLGRSKNCNPEKSFPCGAACVKNGFGCKTAPSTNQKALFDQVVQRAKTGNKYGMSKGETATKTTNTRKKLPKVEATRPTTGAAAKWRSDVMNGLNKRLAGKKPDYGDTQVNDLKDKEIQWTKHPLAKGRVLEVKVADLEKAWNDKENRVEADGKGGIGKRYEDAKNFMLNNPKVNMIEVVAKPDGSVVFKDGRHRFAALRDSGRETIKVVVQDSKNWKPKSDKKQEQPDSNEQVTQNDNLSKWKGSKELPSELNEKLKTFVPQKPLTDEEVQKATTDWVTKQGFMDFSGHDRTHIVMQRMIGLESKDIAMATNVDTEGVTELEEFILIAAYDLVRQPDITFKKLVEGTKSKTEALANRDGHPNVDKLMTELVQRMYDHPYKTDYLKQFRSVWPDSLFYV